MSFGNPKKGLLAEMIRRVRANGASQPFYSTFLTQQLLSNDWPFDGDTPERTVNSYCSQNPSIFERVGSKSDKYRLQPDYDIIHGISNSFLPDARKQLVSSSDMIGRTLTIHFRFKSQPCQVGISKVMGCFDKVENATWFDNPGDERDKPAIVIDGGIKGARVQVVFVLTDGDEE